MNVNNSKKHRVRLFKHVDTDINEFVNDSKDVFFWKVANQFKETAQYQWVEDNRVTLQYQSDDIYTAFGKSAVIYADVDESLYLDYALRFFRPNQEWK